MTCLLSMHINSFAQYGVPPRFFHIYAETMDGGSLIDVSINFVETSGTSIEIIHDGSIKTLDSQDFAVPLGVSLIVQNGKIE